MSSIWKIPIYKRPAGASRERGELVAQALVDEDVYETYENFRWRLHEGYAMSTASQRNPIGELGRSYFLHRLVLGLGASDSRRVDHINRDRLDCRRANLRIVSQAANNQNVTPRTGCRSRYRGVCFHGHSGRWMARATINGVHHYLGYFTDEDEAGEAAATFRAQHMPFSTV